MEEGGAPKDSTDQAHNQESNADKMNSTSKSSIQDQQQTSDGPGDGSGQAGGEGGESVSSPDAKQDTSTEVAVEGDSNHAQGDGGDVGTVNQETEVAEPPQNEGSEENSNQNEDTQLPPTTTSTEVGGSTSAPADTDHTQDPAVTADTAEEKADGPSQVTKTSNETSDTPQTSDAPPTSDSPPKTSNTPPTSDAPPTSADAPPKTSGAPPTDQNRTRPETSDVEVSDGGRGGASGNGGGESARGEEGREERSGLNESSSSSGRRSSTREKRSRRKSRKASTEGGSVPGLRRRSSRVDSRGGGRLSTISAAGGTGSAASGRKYLEVVILSAFQPSDPDGSGYVQDSLFWELLQSPALNLQLTPAELAHLQGLILPDQSGFIPYAEFASRSTDIIASLYTNQPPLEAHWVELATADGSVAVNYNKQTGEVMDKAESGIDVFAGVIDELHKRTDPDKKGYINWKMFTHLLQSAEMSPFLKEQDVKEMKKQFNATVTNGKASYEQFCVLAKELLLRVYRAKDPSESPWCKINSQEFGEVWFNKFTGETHRGLQTGDSREHEIAFISEAYAHVEEVNYELEQYKEQCRVLENQLAKSAEDQETFAAQLYDTGNALDEANLEIIRKDNELDQMKAVIENKDQLADLLRAQLADMDALRTRLLETEQELQAARDTIANRDSSITERDTNIMTLQKQADAATDELKTAHGEMDARDSTLAKFKHQLNTEQKRIKEFEKSVPELEGKLASTKEQLDNTKHTLDEKMSVLGQTRKHLKNARERNMFLEKEMEKLEQTHDKLCGAESEIRTLKTFLTTKTALIEKHKKDLKDVRLKLAELEEKDSRRAIILADVLEKTARQYQQQLGKGPGTGGGLSPRGKRPPAELLPPQLDEARPYSAPAVPQEGAQLTEETDYHAPVGVAKSFTTASTGPMLSHSRTTGPLARGGGGAKQARTRNRSRTVPKLPPIVRAAVKQQRGKTFVFSTANDLKREQKIRDVMSIDHTPSNPNCSCELCRMSASVVGHPSRRPETGLTGMTAKTTSLPGYQGETDVRELALAEQLQIGQRVLVRMKKSEFDLEPTKLTGIIKYVGKVDSEYVDHRIYVGVKLDEAVGDTDGLVKNKRYFTCPAKHGKLVRIANVVAVLPHKSVFYKSLQEISKRSPYTTVQKKLSAQA